MVVMAIAMALVELVERVVRRATYFAAAPAATAAAAAGRGQRKSAISTPRALHPRIVPAERWACPRVRAPLRLRPGRPRQAAVVPPVVVSPSACPPAGVFVPRAHGHSVESGGGRRGGQPEGRSIGRRPVDVASTPPAAAASCGFSGLMREVHRLPRGSLLRVRQGCWWLQGRWGVARADLR